MNFARIFILSGELFRHFQHPFLPISSASFVKFSIYQHLAATQISQIDLVNKVQVQIHNLVKFLTVFITLLLSFSYQKTSLDYCCDLNLDLSCKRDSKISSFNISSSQQKISLKAPICLYYRHQFSYDGFQSPSLTNCSKC